MRELLFSPTVEAARLPDNEMGDAYEATGPKRRAWIKTTLALVQAFHSASPFREERRIENPAAGFSFTSRSCVAPWAVFLLGSQCVSSVRLAAAIMNARLAGIEDILAVCTGELQDPALLAVLELTGVEHVFALSPAHTADFLKELDALTRADGSQGTGRLLSFGESQYAIACAGLPAVPVWLDPIPRIGVFPDAQDELERIVQAHPDASPVSLSDTKEICQEPFDVVYGTGTANSFLHLASNLAGAWICPNLEPAFFMNRELDVSTTA